MPVLDHAIHESVVQANGARYGCFNHADAAGAYFSSMTGQWVQHRMSRECRYDISLKDSKCDGCWRRGQGEGYDQQIRKNGK